MDRLKKTAIDLDLNDKLSRFREEFIIPNNTIYLDGNSLGLLPRNTIGNLNNTVINEWGNDLISSWNKSWIDLPKKVSKKISAIVNSKEEEIYVGSSTSNNLYKLIKSILDANKHIKNISTDSLNYPSDIYICEGISKDYNIDFNILNYENDTIPNINNLKKFILKKKGILVLSHVTYKSSYRYPMIELNRFCKENDIIVIWDLSHSIGAIDINMSKNELNYAIGCTYKYLNGGPGSPAFIYVRKTEIDKLKSPIRGWFSHNNPFNFSEKYEESSSMNKFSNGTPHILSLSSLKTSLDITIDASTKKLENKSEKLFNFFLTIYKEDLEILNFKLITPENKNERGSHISIKHKEAWRISKSLISPTKKKSKKIIIDYRPNDIIRVALTPLYTSFEDIYFFCYRLIEIVKEEEFKKKDNSMHGVT